MRLRIPLMVLFTICSVSATAEENARVLLDSSGHVQFEQPKAHITDTGFTISPEAQKYKSAVEELLNGEKEFIPVETKTVSTRMIRLITWSATKKATKVLTRKGNTIVVVPPSVDHTTTETFENLFGIMALLFFAFLLLANIWGTKDRLVSVASSAAIGAVAFAAVALPIAITDAVFAADVNAIIFIALIFAAAVFVFVANVIFVPEDIAGFRITSALAATFMTIAVVMTV